MALLGLFTDQILRGYPHLAMQLADHGEGAKCRPVCQIPGFLVSSRQGPTGKEVPSRAFLWDVVAGIIAGLLVHWIVRRFM
jgi:fructose-specific phosphotransferase system IIC component